MLRDVQCRTVKSEFNHGRGEVTGVMDEIDCSSRYDELPKHQVISEVQTPTQSFRIVCGCVGRSWLIEIGEWTS